MSGFAAQRVPDGTGAVCCDKTDVCLLDDSDVRIVEGQYEARVNGEWLPVREYGQGKPGNTVFGYTANPTGSAVAWVFHGLPRCFAEGRGREYRSRCADGHRVCGCNGAMVVPCCWIAHLWRSRSSVC